MKKVIIGIVIALVVIGAGAAGYTLIKKNNTNNSTENKTAFSPESTDGQAFTATVTATPKKGNKTLTVMKTDGQGVSQYTIGSNGQSRLVFTKDFYYACSKTSCSKVPSSATAGFVADPKSYDVSQADINNANQSASQQGQQPCPVGGGTCDVWQTSGLIQDDSTGKVYVNTESHRVVQIETENPEGLKTKIVYNYGPVDISVPTNARELNIEIPSGFIEE
jgi:hypothetical protein